MKISLAWTVGFLGFLGFLDSTIAQSGTAGRGGQVTGIDAARSSDWWGPESRLCRGLYLRSDGMTVGRVQSIDPGSLRLVPMQGVVVTFLQGGRIVGQATTDDRGVFAVPDLTPWAVYSVTAASEQWVSAFSVVLRPGDGLAGDATAGRTEAVWTNDLRFVLAWRQDENREWAGVDGEEEVNGDSPEEPGAVDVQGDGEGSHEYLEYPFHEFQLMPREDFVAALRAGAFGYDVALPPAPVFPMQPLGVGGGAGAGAGAGAGDGLGAALLGGGIGAAIGAAATDQDRPPPVVTPFEP